ncbi:hypothetical protein DPEC_G00274880 [Dallia pectoralis]|uniref:Uncharacterized protein n=1 Tax=Dallia pectoralis TaxID=75939 RepID=A0ACC2FL53_DALPE|nr:hypothetical protein DPEC_G00274880 [Dallia pectoralis]
MVLRSFITHFLKIGNNVVLTYFTLSAHDVTDNERCLFWILGKQDPAHLDNRLNKVSSHLASVLCLLALFLRVPPRPTRCAFLGQVTGRANRQRRPLNDNVEEMHPGRRSSSQRHACKCNYPGEPRTLPAGGRFTASCLDTHLPGRVR